MIVDRFSKGRHRKINVEYNKLISNSLGWGGAGWVLGFGKIAASFVYVKSILHIRSVQIYTNPMKYNYLPAGE